MRVLRRVVVLAVTAAPALACPAGASYDAPPFGHHDVREIVIVDHTGDPRMADGAQHAADLWNATGANFHLSVAPGTVTTSDGACYDNSVPGRIHLCMDVQYAYQGGFTSWEYEPGSNVHLRAAYIHMCGNGVPFCFDFDDPANVRRIVPHEVGHALGLYHQSSPTAGDTCSIMSVTCYSETPSTEDIDTLRALYDHPDGVSMTMATTTTTVVATTTTTSTVVATTTTTTTTAPVVTTTTGVTTTMDPICAALARQYVAYTGNPAAQTAIRQQQIARGCLRP